MRCLRGYWKGSTLSKKSLIGEAMRCLRGYWKCTGATRGINKGEAMRCLRGYWKGLIVLPVREQVKPCVVCVATGSNAV